jgi:hypothetical protein
MRVQSNVKCSSLIGNAGMAPEKAYEAMDPSEACDRSLEHIGAWDPEERARSPQSPCSSTAPNISCSGNFL